MGLGSNLLFKRKKYNKMGVLGLGSIAPSKKISVWEKWAVGEEDLILWENILFKKIGVLALGRNGWWEPWFLI